MIITEHRIRDIVSYIPGIDLNANNLAVQPKFGWGDKQELDRYLLKKKTDSYPLIWLLPSKDNYIDNGFICEKSCTLVIAMLEINADLYNDERYLKSFDLVLNPLTNYLVEGLRNSNISGLVPDEWDILKRPNYSESKFNKSGETISATIDLWDAVELNCAVQFNNEPLRKIQWVI